MSLKNIERNPLAKRMFECRYFLLGFFIIFVCNAVLSTRTDLKIGYDNHYYWWLFSEKITADWKVNFSELETWRGYVFPAYCAILNKSAGGGYKYFILLNSMMNAFMFMYIIPKFQRTYFSQKASSLFSDLNFAIMFIFFSGVFLYTLSDSYALYMCLFSVFFLMRSEEEKSSVRLFLNCFCCGVFSYFAYNIRTIYMFSGIATFILFCIFVLGKQNSWLRRLACTIFLFLGLLFASLPQAFLNYKHNGVKSVFVPTQSLMLAQCSLGIAYQRYDSFTGFFIHEEHEQEIPQMKFEDPVGKKLLEEEHIKVFPTWKAFAKFCLKYPFEVVGIYVRHLANALFPCWPNVYVMKINNNKVLYALLSIALVFSFGLAVVFRCVRNLKFFVYFIPALVSCLFILPGAVEARFFLALFLMFSGTMCFNVDYKKLLAMVNAHKISVAFIFMVFSGLMISQWALFLMSESEIPIFMLGR